MGLLAFWGYVADFSYRALRDQTLRPLWLAFVLDLPGAIFFGIMTYYLGTATGTDEWVLAAMVGIAGHIGGRGVYRLETLLLAKLGGGPTEGPKQ